MISFEFSWNSNLSCLKGSDSISISQTLTLKHNIHKREKKISLQTFLNSADERREQSVLYNFETQYRQRYGKIHKYTQIYTNIHKQEKENQFCKLFNERREQSVLYNFERKEQGFKLKRKLGGWIERNQIEEVHSNVNFWIRN